MDGFNSMFPPTLDGLNSINADSITTASLNGISSSIIGYISNARSSLQTQIDAIDLSGITGVNLTAAPLLYIVNLTSDAQLQLNTIGTALTALQSQFFTIGSAVIAIETTLASPPITYLSTLRSDVQVQIDSIEYTVTTGVDFTAAPLLYTVGLRSNAQAQIDALTLSVSGISYPADISCNTLTATSYVNCNSGIVNATWTVNKLKVNTDIEYIDGRFNGALGGPFLQDIVDTKISFATTSLGTAVALQQALVQGQIAVLNAGVVSLEANDFATGVAIGTLKDKTRYISTDYNELAFTGGNTYCSSNFRIGDATTALISLYPSGQISATTFAGDLCNVELSRADVFNSHSANADMHIGSPSLTDVYVNRTITIGDKYPTSNCTVKTTHDLNIARRCRAFGFNSVSLNTNLWIGDDGTDGQALARSMILGDYFGDCTVNVLTTLAVGVKITAPTVNIATLLSVGAGITLTALTGAITSTSLVTNALTINTSVNGLSVTVFNGITRNIQIQLNEKAPSATPAFTGIPTAPTADRYDNSAQIATTAYVKSQLYALRDSETLTGIPRAPTATPANNTTQIATTAFVQNQANSYISNVTLTGTPTLTIDSSPVTTDNSYRIASTNFVKGQAYATLAAPAFTGAATFSGTLNNITPAVFDFLSGATSNIQAQLNAVGAGILGAVNNWTGASNTFTGLVRITNTTATTSGITGALVVSGGVGIGDDLYVVGDGNFQGDLLTYDVLTYTGTCVTHNNTITGTLTQTAGTTNITSTTNTTLTALTTAIVGKLTVSSDTRLRTCFFDDPTYATTDYSYIQYVKSVPGNSALRIVVQSAADDHICLLPTGYVGIKTESPTVELDVNGSGKISANFAVGGNFSVNGTAEVLGNAYVRGNLRIGIDDPNGGSGDKAYIQYGSYGSAGGDGSVLRIIVENDGAQDHINLKPSGYVGIKTDTPTVELDVAGSARITGTFAVGGTAGITGKITGSGGITTTGGLVSLTSTGAMTLATQSSGAMTLTAGDFSLGGLTTIFNADGGHKFLATGTTFCVGCAEAAYAAYGLYTSTTEKIYLNTTSTAEYLSTGSTSIIAGSNLVLSATNSVIFGSQFLKQSITITTSGNYSFGSMASVPNIIFINALAGGVNIYLPDSTSSLYNGLHVMIRLVGGSAGITLRITNNPSRLASRSSANAAASFLGIGSSEDWCGHFLYLDGYWYDTR